LVGPPLLVLEDIEIPDCYGVSEREVVSKSVTPKRLPFYTANGELSATLTAQQRLGDWASLPSEPLMIVLLTVPGGVIRHVFASAIVERLKEIEELIHGMCKISARQIDSVIAADIILAAGGRAQRPNPSDNTIMKILVISLSAVIVVAAATAGHADPLFDKYFGKLGDGAPCYTREYDAQHLRQHSRQKIKRITLAFDPAKVGTSATEDQFEVTLGIMVKGMTEFFTSPAYCSVERSGFLCRVEGDGGEFRMKPASGDGLILQVNGDGLRMEGKTGTIEVGGKRSDDNLFTLAHVGPDQCKSIVDR
jgi:hypothetical protein